MTHPANFLLCVCRADTISMEQQQIQARPGGRGIVHFKGKTWYLMGKKWGTLMVPNIKKLL